MFIILRGSAFMLATENREMVMTRLSCNFMDFLYLLKVCSKYMYILIYNVFCQRI